MSTQTHSTYYAVCLNIKQTQGNNEKLLEIRARSVEERLKFKTRKKM